MAGKLQIYADEEPGIAAKGTKSTKQTGIAAKDHKETRYARGRVLTRNILSKPVEARRDPEATAYRPWVRIVHRG